MLEAAAAEAIGAKHEREGSVEVVFAAAGEEVAVVEAKAQAGFAVLEQEALDGDGVRLMAPHDFLHGGVGPHGVVEGSVAQVGDVAGVGADGFGQPRHLRGQLGLVEERVELVGGHAANGQAEEGLGGIFLLLELAGDAEQAALGHPRHGVDGAQAALQRVPVLDGVDVLHAWRVAEVGWRGLVVGADGMVKDDRTFPGVEDGLELGAEGVVEVEEEQGVGLVGVKAVDEGADGGVGVEGLLLEGECEIEAGGEAAQLGEELGLLLFRGELVARPGEPLVLAPAVFVLAGQDDVGGRIEESAANEGRLLLARRQVEAGRRRAKTAERPESESCQRGGGLKEGSAIAGEGESVSVQIHGPRVSAMTGRVNAGKRSGTRGELC